MPKLSPSKQARLLFLTCLLDLACQLPWQVPLHNRWSEEALSSYRYLKRSIAHSILLERLPESQVTALVMPLPSGKDDPQPPLIHMLALSGHELHPFVVTELHRTVRRPCRWRRLLYL